VATCDLVMSLAEAVPALAGRRPLAANLVTLALVESQHLTDPHEQGQAWALLIPAVAAASGDERLDGEDEAAFLAAGGRLIDEAGDRTTLRDRTLAALEEAVPGDAWLFDPASA
jgi:hypothetical protein